MLPTLSHWDWQAALNKLPTTVKLHNRKIITNDMCSYCELDEETLHHIFYECTFAIEIRSILCLFPPTQNYPKVILTWKNLLEGKGCEHLWKEILLCWKLWGYRNKRLFCHTQLTPTSVRWISYMCFLKGYTPFLNQTGNQKMPQQAISFTNILAGLLKFQIPTFSLMQHRKMVEDQLVTSL